MGEIYNDSASFGKFLGWIRTVVLLLIALACFGVGIYDLVTKETVHTNSVTGVVKSSSCSLSNLGNRTDDISNGLMTSHQSIRYICDVVFEYSYNGVNYSSRQAVTGKVFNAGESVTLYFNRDSPMKASVNKILSKHTTGWILLGVGALFSLFAFASWYILKFKFANSATAWSSLYRAMFR